MQQTILIAAFDAILACSYVLPDGTIVSESGWFLHRWGTPLLTGIAALLFLSTMALLYLAARVLLRRPPAAAASPSDPLPG